MPGEFGRYSPEGAENWHPTRSDFEEPKNPEKPHGRPIERDSKGTVESLDDMIAHNVEKRDVKERWMALLIVIDHLLRQKLYKQVARILLAISRTKED